MRLTKTTTTMMAIMPPWEMETELLELSPEAPASVPASTSGALSSPYGFSEASGKGSVVVDMLSWSRSRWLGCQWLELGC